MDMHNILNRLSTWQHIQSPRSCCTDEALRSMSPALPLPEQNTMPLSALGFTSGATLTGVFWVVFQVWKGG